VLFWLVAVGAANLFDAPRMRLVCGGMTFFARPLKAEPAV
jgi:hypothetical protein